MIFNFQDEINKFNNASDDWWNKHGEFKILHLINILRVEFIHKCISSTIKDQKVLDIGCGGGILCESLANNDACVTGIDAGEDNINIAREHALTNKLNIQYTCVKAEDFQPDEQYDIVCAMEVIEHTEHWNMFLDSISKFVKPGGFLFISTLNRNVKSYLLGIIAAEYVLKWVKRGTHTWSKFLKPSEISQYLDSLDFKLIEASGLKYNIFKNTWSLDENLDVNFILCFQKKIL